MLEIKRLVLGPFEVNCYLVTDTLSGEAMIIDPAARSEDLVTQLEDKQLKYIINTHGHFDHIGGNAYLKTQFPQVPLVVHSLDAALLSDPANNLSTYFIEPVVSVPADLIIEGEGYGITLGTHSFTTLLLPGHTPGGIGIYSAGDKMLFSGDFIFPHSVGRTDMPGGDLEDLKKSVLRIVDFADDLMVYPGHEDPFPLSDFKSHYQDILAFEA